MLHIYLYIIYKTSSRKLEIPRETEYSLTLTQAKLAGLVSIHVPDGNSARKMGSKKEATRGNESFQKLIRFLYFLGLLIYLLLHIEKNGNFKVTWGSAHLTIVKIRCFI